MSRAGSGWGWGKLAKMVAVATVLAVGAVAAGLWVEQASKLAKVRAGVGFLVALEVAYGAALAACAVAVPLLAARVVRGRRRGLRRTASAKMLALAVSVLLSLGLCEFAAASLGKGRDEVAPKAATEDDARVGVRAGGVDLPTEFWEEKGKDEVEIVVIGESSADGVPYSLFNLKMGCILDWKLKEAIPNRRFHLNSLATSGDTLEGQHRKLAMLSRKPDLLVVYCGHNEFSARLPAGREVAHYVDAGEPTPWESFVAWVERTSPGCGLIRRAADRLRVAIPPPVHGNRKLVDVPACSPAEYAARLDDFRTRLEAIVSYAERIGAVVVLVSPPANDAGFEPNRSVLPPQTRRAEREAFAYEFEAARRLESDDPAGAERAYRALLERQPGFAEAHFRLGRLLERAGSWDEAYRHYVAARDADAMPMRCPTEFQAVYREVAARHKCPLIDGQAYFHSIGRHGLLDDRLFHDGMHPSLFGQAALAQAVLRELHARRAFGWPEGAPAPTVTPGECARRFGLTSAPWSKICHWGIMFYDLTSPSRFDPTERRAKQDRFGKAADRIDAGTPPEKVGLVNIGVHETVDD